MRSPPLPLEQRIRQVHEQLSAAERRLADRQRRELLGARLLGVLGQVQREGEVVHLVAGRLVDLSTWLGALETVSRDFH